MTALADAPMGPLFVSKGFGSGRGFSGVLLRDDGGGTTCGCDFAGNGGGGTNCGCGFGVLIRAAGGGGTKCG